MCQEFYRCPPTHQAVGEKIKELRERHRALKVFPVGKSALGRDIQALCLGEPTLCTLFVGATHGLEWLTGMLLLRFLENILGAMEAGGSVSDIDVNKALSNRSLVVIPFLNPDGVEIALRGIRGAGERGEEVARLCDGQDPGKIWQANARGVDLNHNFDAGWQLVHEMERERGIDGPAPTRFGGPHPGSEPETAAVTAFCVTYQPRSLYSFHSQGEEIYYRYGEHTPVRSRMIAQILASSSGYALSKPVGIASHGGLKDWFIDKFHRPGFTVEVGRGRNPLPVMELEPIYRRLEEMLMLATLL